MRIETRPAVEELVDTIARELWVKELQGELPDGATAEWTTLLDETLIALSTDHALHPGVHEEEDPDRRGYRAVRVGQWRLIYRATKDRVVVVHIVHVRAQLRAVVDHG